VLFPTATFTVFFLIVLPLSWLAMSDLRRWRIFIIVASYVFYGWWDWHFVLLLAGCTVWTHLFAIRIARAKEPLRRWLVFIAVAGDLALLGYFKYYDFFVSSSHNLLADVGVGLPLSIRTIVLPVGVSFFTFMAISYLVDTYRGEFTPVTLPKFAAYLSFFPHIVAGPIVRPGELIPQMETRRDPRRVDTSRAFYLIATGLFKKVVIANYLATHICDQVFAVPGTHSSAEILVATYAYAVQIYADFSGYTDMAIGIALLLGFTFPQNFDSPYTATSLQNFWRRWHMTLSRWLRDYLYIPLGGNRKGRVRTYVNLIVTMLLGGLWHGASWTFVVWGGIHGTGLAFERWRRDRSGQPEHVAHGARIWVQRLVTFNVVCLAWIFFRSDSIARAWQMITGLFTQWGRPSPLITAGVLVWIVVGIGTQYLPSRFPLAVMARFSRLPVVGQAAVLGAALMLANAMGPAGISPFIYYRF
jgi:D-alanyl-lipoteichoic acid acyltransferase DltB (MBOAT superfamily)